MRFRPQTGLLLAAVSLIVLVVPPPEATADSTFNQLAALRDLAPTAVIDSPAISGTVALHGIVKNSSGKPVGAGSPVFVFAAPSPEQKLSMKINQPIELQLVAATITDSMGRYRFIDSSVLPSLMALQSEYQYIIAPTVNGPSGMEIVDLLQNPMPEKLATSITGIFANPAITETDRQASQLPTNYVAQTAVVGDIVLPSSATTALQLRSQIAMPKTRATVGKTCPGKNVCFVVKLINSWQQSVLVGQSSSKKSDVRTQFTYAQGSTSTVGWGITSKTNYSNLSMSGTRELTSTLSTSYAEVTGVHNKQYFTTYMYGKYQHEEFYGKTRRSMWYSVEPTGQYGGGSSTREVYGTLTSRNPGAYCAFVERNQRKIIDSTTATTFSFGVAINIAGVKGDFSSRSGYNSKTSLSFYFPTSGFLCGVSGAPGFTNPGPGLVYASSTMS